MIFRDHTKDPGTQGQSHERVISMRVLTDARCECRCILVFAVAAVCASVAVGEVAREEVNSERTVGAAVFLPAVGDLEDERVNRHPSEAAAIASAGGFEPRGKMEQRHHPVFSPPLRELRVDLSRLFSFGRSRDDHDGGGSGGSGGDGSGAGDFAGETEAHSIQAREVPFLLQKGQWQGPGGGISMTAKGEPKSGTTWLGRLMPQLALQLCGSPTNTWCIMGGLVVHPNKPSPWYEFEMLKKSGNGNGGAPTLFLHFKGNYKHVIPGMSMAKPPDGCTNGGWRHENFFEDSPPCRSGDTPTRKRLRSCLWNTSRRCIRFALGSFRRTAVIFRDPRDVVVSEFHMRRDFYHQARVKGVVLDDFVRERFETLVSWTHQRWVWHVEILDENSHDVFYDDLKANHMGMIRLAEFMGLRCSEDQALKVWKSHQTSSHRGDYTAHGLPVETIEWMNATMARLLPPVASLHWGLTPTDV